MDLEPVGTFIVSIFAGLKPDRFPLTFTLLDRASRQECWQVTLDGPASILCPPREEVNGGRLLAARVTWPGGIIREDDWP